MKHRFEVLDIFRGLFSTMVVFFHLSPFAETIILNNKLVENSDLFVDFFFVLSGFVIAYSYREIENGEQFKLFLKKRFFRLYPLHVIMLFVFLIVEVAKHYLVGHIAVNNLDNPNNNVLTFFSSLFLINSVKLPGVTDVSWNIPSWSISAEMISYIVFAVMLFFISKAGLRKITGIIVIAIAIVAAVCLVLAKGSMDITSSFDYGFLRGIMGFFTGVLCFHVFYARHESLFAASDAGFHVAEPAILAVLLYFVLHKEQYQTQGYIYEVLFFAAVFIFSFEKGFISKSLKQVVFLKKMGQYSYSIYLTHAFLLSMFNILFIRVLHFSPSAYSYLFLLNYILIYFVSQWTYNNIEMRFNLKRKKKESSQ